MTSLQPPVVLNAGGRNRAHPTENSQGYKSGKTFRKELLSDEKGSAIRGLMFSVPAMALGGMLAYRSANTLRPMVNKMPMVIQKAVKTIFNKTDPSTFIKTKIMALPVMKAILRSVPGVSKKELYDDIVRQLSDPKLRVGLAGAALSGYVGNELGSFSGGIKALNKTEKELGYVPSTKKQYLGRSISGIAGGAMGGASGLFMGSRLDKMLPTLKGNSPAVRAANLGRHAVSYIALPTILGGAGQQGGKYLTSRYLQKHVKADDA